MPLPRLLKIELIERFVPILCLDPEEPTFPVSPSKYVEAAALWASTPPSHARVDWGQPGAVGREPVIPRGGISLDPAEDVRGLSDPDGDGVPEHYLGQRDEGRFTFLESDREHWLDRGGWQDAPDVGPASLNRRARLEEADGEGQPWFTADVWTFDDLAAGLGAERLAERLGLGPDDRPPQLERIVVVSFGFLFPGHRQPRRLTELAPDEDPWSGDFEGDWCYFSVITRSDEPDLNAARVESFVPLHGAFGQRYRGTTPDRENNCSARALLRSWSAMMRVGDHPVVAASEGIHNLQPHDPPLNSEGRIDLQWVEFGNSASEPANNFVSDAVEQPAAALFALKVLAGAAIGGGIGGVFGAAVGAVIGGIAAAAEAAAGEEEGLYDVPELEAGPNPPDPPGEDPFSEDSVDLAKDDIAKPAGLGEPAFFDSAHAQSMDWVCSAEQSLIDGSIVLDLQAGFPAFPGRWGVRCDGDRFLIRSGMKIPAYRLDVADALLLR